MTINYIFTLIKNIIIQIVCILENKATSKINMNSFGIIEV